MSAYKGYDFTATITYMKQQRSKSHIFGGGGGASATPPPLDTRPHSHNVYYVDTPVWYKWCLVSQWGGGGGAMFHKIIPFLVVYIVKYGHIDPKISKIIPNSEIFLPDTEDPLSGN